MTGLLYSTMWCNPAAPGGAASAGVPTLVESAVEAESEGVWTGWFNNMNPFEEGQQGDLELRKDMDPVSSDWWWTFSIDDIPIAFQWWESVKTMSMENFGILLFQVVAQGW